jgi:hypothetical protein
MIVRLSVVAVCCALIGCADGSVERGGMVRRDSAGIEMVEHSRVDSASVTWWLLDEEPAVSIGAVEGTPEQFVYQVRDAVRLSDGRIVIASSGSDDVRYYGEDGRHLRTSGRRGSGPGEFVFPQDLVRMRGDSLLVHDFAQNRLTVLDPSGEYVRDRASQRVDQVLGIGDDGSLAVRLRIAPGTNTAPPGRIFRPQAPHAVIREDAAPDTLGVFPGPEAVRVSGTLNRRPFEFPMDPLWGRLAFSTFHDGQLFVATGEAPEFRMYDGAGRLVRIVRIAPGLEPVGEEATVEIRKALAANAEAAVAPDLKDYTEAYARRPAHETLPPYLDMRVAADGNVWLRDYDVHWTSELWTVYSPNGSRLSRVRIPWRFRIFEIGSDYVLGHERDELDVEYVRMYRLRRGN